MEIMSDLGSSRKFIWSIVTAQMLVQIGAFSLPASLQQAWLEFLRRVDTILNSIMQ
jgi:hypothetical protein